MQHLGLMIVIQEGRKKMLLWIHFFYCSMPILYPSSDGQEETQSSNLGAGSTQNTKNISKL
jgi:hypothetical protein